MSGNLIGCPLDFIDGLLTSRKSEPDWANVFEEEFSKNPNTVGQIPRLNCVSVESMQINGLVRYRGVVRDVHSPEFYASRLESGDGNNKTVHFTKYRDELDLKEGVDYREVEYRER